MAFAVTTKHNSMVEHQQPLHNKDWIRWDTDLKYYDSKGNKSILHLKNHICDESDWKKFYPVKKRQEKFIKDFKARQVFVCLNEWQKDKDGKDILLTNLNLYGNERIN
jgi:hypothetical protein